jgi:putative DNA methylase
MVEERPDLEPYEGKGLTVIAWIWARTVKSPNPAFADVDVPLASTFMLSTKYQDRNNSRFNGLFEIDNIS